MSSITMDMRTLGRGPLIVVAATFLSCAAALLYAHAAYSPATAGRVLDGCLEELLPTGAGMAVIGVLAGDPALELQATARRALPRLALIRVGALILLALIAAGIVCALAGAITVVAPRNAPGELALTTFAPVLFLAALGLAASVLMRGAAAASALILALVAAENIAAGSLSTGALRRVFLFATTYTPDMSGWLGNRLALILCGLVLLGLGVWAASRPGVALALVHGDPA